MSEWYYVREGVSKGPVSEDEVRSALRSGELPPAGLVWKEGMTEWRAAHLVTDFAEMAGGTLPPPLPSMPGLAPAVAPETSGKAVGSLIASIVGFMACMFIGQIIGIILGHSARREIAASEGRLSGDSLALAGIVVGWVGIALDILLVLGLVIFFAVGMQGAWL